MILQNLIGLLVLLAVPILIVIYIIKQEHKERRVSSTYIWRVSERFLKKRLPLRRVSKLLSFILQLLILTLLGLSAALPAVSMGSISAHIAVIDASASMQTQVDGVSRFDRAVEQVMERANSGLCSSMTVILASDTPSYLVNGGTPAEVSEALKTAECGWGSGDIYAAMRLVREAYASLGSAKVIFYTDTEYASAENVEIVDMRNDKEKNVAVTSLAFAAGRFEGTLVSYGEDREVAVGLYVDGAAKDTKTVFCANGEPSTVRFDTDISSFREATLMINEADSLAEDNSYTVIGKMSEMADVLVIGEETLFWEAGFAALGNCEVTVKEAYDESDDGKYDLYIFSNCLPSGRTDRNGRFDLVSKTDTIQFPERGTVLCFSRLSKISNDLPIQVSYRGGSMDGSYLQIGFLEVDPLLQGAEDAIEQVYLSCDFYAAFRGHIGPIQEQEEPAQWKTVCLKDDGGYAAWVKITGQGYRQYIFPFPLSETNLPLTAAFMAILNNARTIAAPPVVPKTQYAVGEEVIFNLKDEAKEPVVVSPEGEKAEISLKSPVFIPDTPGVYTLHYELNDTEREASFFAHIPSGEYESYSSASIYLIENAQRNSTGNLLATSLVPLFAGIMLAVLIFEWGYYYRGKY